MPQLHEQRIFTIPNYRTFATQTWKNDPPPTTGHHKPQPPHPGNCNRQRTATNPEPTASNQPPRPQSHPMTSSNYPTTKAQQRPTSNIEQPRRNIKQQLTTNVQPATHSQQPTTNQPTKKQQIAAFVHSLRWGLCMHSTSHGQNEIVNCCLSYLTFCTIYKK